MRFGHHLYNWDWEETTHLSLHLAQTRAAGWEGFEGKVSELRLSAETVAGLCGQHNVRCAAVAGDIANVIDYAYAAGAQIVRSGFPAKDTQRWVEYADARGIIITIHNHIGGVETREDLLRYLDDRPGTYACPDTGHLLLCGSDPLATIRDLGDRCGYVHLKDINPAAIGSWEHNGEHFWELGTGGLDLAGVMSTLEDIGFSGWVTVERDCRVADYGESAHRMREVLRQHGY